MVSSPRRIVAEAQPPGKMYRIGFLGLLSPTDNPYALEAFRQELRELGYVEGQTVVIEYRFAEGRPELLPGLAAELVRLKVDVIVPGAPPAPEAAKQATSTIPIVFTVTGDPVAEGRQLGATRRQHHRAGQHWRGGRGEAVGALKEVAAPLRSPGWPFSS